MKRFLLLLITILCVGATYATTEEDLAGFGLSVDKCYRLKNNSFSNLYLGVDAANLTLCGLADDNENRDEIWKVELTEDGVCHMRTLSGYYIAGTSKETHTAVSTTEPSQVGFTLISTGVISPWWGEAAGGGDAGHCFLMNANATLGNWGPWTAKSQYVIEEAIDPEEMAQYTHTYTKDQIITLSNVSNPMFYATDGGTQVKAGNLDTNSYWQLVPALGNEYYYIRNITTGQYIQDCAADEYYQNPVPVGATPVEYALVKGTQTDGWALLPTSQPDLDLTNGKGLSLDEDNACVVGFDARDGIDAESFWTLTVLSEVPSHPLEGTVYTIKNMNFDQWAADLDDGSNQLKSVTEVDDPCQFQFVPTTKSDCYYIQNVYSGKYVQSSKEAYNGHVMMGENPVEYYVKVATSYAGYYGLASTDQDVYDFSSSACVGWNLVQGDQYITGYNAQDGVNGKSFWKLAPFKAAAHEFDADHVYAISNKNAQNKMYAEDTADGLATAALSDASYWRFIPTDHDNCYYIQNTKTGKYAQSSYTNYNAQIATGSDPVEYCITAATSFGGLYSICSTDQDKYDGTDAACTGWNMMGSGDAAIVAYNAKDGTNGKSFWKIDVLDSIPEHPLADGTYSVKNRNFDQWVCDKGETQDDGSLIISSKEAIEEDCEWQFIPTLKSNCYYILNTKTGRYAQSTARGVAYNLSIKMGDTPVEYCIKPATSFAGYWGIASTDQEDYGFASAECIGWNLAQSAYHVVGYSACDGTNAKSFWQIDKYGKSSTGDHYFTDDLYITIQNKNFAQYPADFGTKEGDEVLLESSETMMQECVWQFVPAEGDENYYIVNRVTGRYAQSSAAAYNGKVKMGTTPVIYHVTSSGSWGGYYGIASTDQEVYDCTAATCVGWNLVQNDHYVTGYNAQDGVNAKSFWWVTTISADEYNALPTSITSVKGEAQGTQKILRDGQIIILKGQNEYTVTGMQLK